MGIPILFLRIEGPMQSWGTRARWDIRDTAPEPTKSGLIGLLGCAMGYPVGDARLVTLDDALSLGVRVENPGRKMVDYHTISGVLPTADGGVKGNYANLATIVSPRAYLQDAAFLVALTGEESVIKECRSALLRPTWPLFLGRKSCPPVRPLFESVSHQYTSLVDALTHFPWGWEGKVVLKGQYPQRLRCLVDSYKSGLERQDIIRVNPARMYAFRNVKEFYVDFPGVEKEVPGCISHA